jgi:hypothetical protein
MSDVTEIANKIAHEELPHHPYSPYVDRQALARRIASALAEAEKRGRDAVAGMVYETPPGEFSPDGWTWKQAFAAEKVRRIEAEAEIETLHQKYAQERMSRSRQTISDNTKMENQ